MRGPGLRRPTHSLAGGWCAEQQQETKTQRTLTPFTHSSPPDPNRLGRTIQAIQKVKSLFETSNWQTDGPGRVFFMKPSNPIGSFVWDCALHRLHAFDR